MRINILGYGATREQCPDDGEVWGINIAGKLAKKACRFCFAFDNLPPEYVAEMKFIAPVVSWQPYADIHYPLAEIIKKYRCSFFQNTISYIIPYAIDQRATELAFWGCDMPLGATWEREAKGVEFWLGVAHAKRIKLILPRGDNLLRNTQGRIYGAKGREILLSLQERLALLAILPAEASYQEQLYAATLQWIMRPKGDEVERYHIHHGYDSMGNVTFICKQKFLIDIPMAEPVWQYLKQLLIKREEERRLTSGLLSVYEKIVSSEWRPGEYKGLEL